MQMSSNPVKLLVSIICLSLIIMSGDVELNPGPQVLFTVKPTKDDLMQLINSSQLTTNGTSWEQFVCCLPNMDQEIIDDIKQREPTNNVVSAVAQYWLDNYHASTWKEIIMALLEMNEIGLIQQILADHSATKSDPEVSDICKTLRRVLRTHFASLKDVTESSIEHIAAELYSKCLISRGARNCPRFEKIEIEFETLLSFLDLSTIQSKCQTFLECLSNIEGPAKLAANSLAHDWEQELLKCHNLSISLKSHQEESISFQTHNNIELHCKNDIALQLQSLQKEFLSLLTKIRQYYDESEQYKLIHIARWVEEYLEVSAITTTVKTIDELFNKIRFHYDYDFLNYEIIKDLIEEFPTDDKLLAEWMSYVDRFDAFEDSCQIQDMIGVIETALKNVEQSQELTCEICISLTGKWGEKNKKNLRKLINYLFPGKGKFLKLVDIRKGSITIQFFVSSSQILSLVIMAQIKADYMYHLGIFYLSINNHLIINEQEDVDFTFEQSLLYAIKNIETKSEYENISYFLLAVGCDVNYQNEKGETALMLATTRRHENIVKLLLQNNAQPNNNTDTKYHSKITTENTDLKLSPHENFTRLYTKFQELDANFKKALIEAVTTGAVSLSRVIDFLCSYVEKNDSLDINEFIVCLQPHYSCLNIHLLHEINKQFLLEQKLTHQIESHITDLKELECTTYLQELNTIFERLPVSLPPVGVKVSNLIIKFNNKWITRKIADLRKFEENVLPNLYTLLNLIETYQEESLLVCVYFIPNVQADLIVATLRLVDQEEFIIQLGICQVFVNDLPLIEENVNNDYTFEMALQQAMQTDNDRIISFLLDINIVLSTTTDQQPSFKNVTDNTQIAQLLLKKGYHLNFKIEPELALFKLDEIIEQLLTIGANLDIQDNNGWTALMCASANGLLHIVEHLLSYEVNTNIQDNDGLTALILASANSHYQIVKLLLTKETDVDIVSNDGLTALTTALVNMDDEPSQKYLESIELLLDHGAKLPVINNLALSSLDIVAAVNNVHSAELILTKCNISTDDIAHAFIMAYYGGHAAMMACLSTNIPSLVPNERELLIAIVEGNLGIIISKLFEEGLSPDTPLVSGITPLMIAASCGHIEIVDTLIQAGANISSTDDEGQTVLDTMKTSHNFDIVSLLEAEGAISDLKHSNVESNSRKIFKIILDLKNLSLKLKISKIISFDHSISIHNPHGR